MNIQLKSRGKDHVITFFNQTQDKEIQQLFPFSTNTLDDAIELYYESQKPDAKSFGKTIYSDNKYIGDIWCYSVDEDDEKMAMLSIVIFNKDYWGKGIAPVAIKEFIPFVFDKYNIDKIGAFTYSYNKRSINALQKSGFCFIESFVEDGEESKYFEYSK